MKDKKDIRSTPIPLKIGAVVTYNDELCVISESDFKIDVENEKVVLLTLTPLRKGMH